VRIYDGLLALDDHMALSPGIVDVPVRLARLAAGRGLSSYQLRLTFNSDMLSVTDVSTTGTATAGWSTSHHVAGGTLSVAGATAGSLTGPGTLLVVRFAVHPSISLRTETYLTIDQLLVNEGTPILERRNGAVRIAEPPGRVALSSPGNGWTQRPVVDDLWWNPVEFAQWYEVQISPDTTFSVISFSDTNVTALPYRAGPLAHGRWYAWRVRARNSLGVGAWSDKWLFRTVFAIPAAPSLAAPPTGSLDLPVTPMLAWHPTDQAATYDVQISEDSTFAFDVRTVGSITDTFHLASTLDHARRYFWRVRGVSEAGWGDWSAPWWFRTVGTPAGVPVLVSPPNGATGISVTPLLVWRIPPNAQLYHVQVSEDSTFATTVVNGDGISDTSYVANGLAPSKVYFWRVRTYGPTDTSAFAPYWRFTTTGPDGVVEPTGSVPDRFGLDPNFPNPFNPSTRLTFHLIEPSDVTLTIYTVTGVEVERLVGTRLAAGTYTTTWNAARMPSGIYLSRLQAGRNVAVQRLVLIK
jgi:hypothetical protein